MEWIQFLIVVMTIGSFLWMARSDYRHLDAKIDSMRELTQAIQMEMKDFHVKLTLQDQEFKNRLCEIEKNRK